MTVLPVKLLVQLFRVLPRGATFAVGRGLGWIYGNLVRYRRADALDALRRSFPEKDERELKRIRAAMYRNLGLTLVDSLRMASMSAEQLGEEVYFVDEHHLREGFERGKGLVAATAHLGNWETIAAVGPIRGYPETIVVKDIRPPALNDYLVSIRSRFGTEVLPRRGSYRACLRALKKEKKLLGFIIDQNTIADQGVFVEFFGRPACTTGGAAFLAQQAGAPIVPVLAIRQPDGRCAIHCLPLIEPPPDRGEESIRAATQAATTAVESMIRQYPEQWTWIHRRWRTRPPGDEEPGKAEETL